MGSFLLCCEIFCQFSVKCLPSVLSVLCAPTLIFFNSIDFIFERETAMTKFAIHVTAKTVPVDVPLCVSVGPFLLYVPKAFSESSWSEG